MIDLAVKDERVDCRHMIDSIISVGIGGRLQLLSVLVVDNIIGEASRIGYGSAIAVMLMLVTLGFVITYLVNILREDSR